MYWGSFDTNSVLCSVVLRVCGAPVSGLQGRSSARECQRSLSLSLSLSLALSLSRSLSLSLYLCVCVCVFVCVCVCVCVQPRAREHLREYVFSIECVLYQRAVRANI